MIAVAVQEHVHPRRPLAAVLVELWNRSWDSALGALGAAVQMGALSSGEAAAHRTKLAAEREVINLELRELTRMLHAG